MKLKRPLAFFDLETSGTNTSTDRIVEIAIIKFNSDLMDMGEATVFRLNPTIPIPKEASDIHGITDEMVKDSPTFKDVSEQIYHELLGCDLASYNGINFDIPLLNAEFERVGVDFPAQDTLLIDACILFKRFEERTLSAATKFYLDEVHDSAHSALGDVDMTVKILRAQIERYSLPQTMEELHELSLNGRKIVDWAGKLSKDEQGDLIFTFGKHKGKKCKTELNYCSWMVDKGDFSNQTKSFLKTLLNPVAL